MFWKRNSWVIGTQSPKREHKWMKKIETWNVVWDMIQFIEEKAVMFLNTMKCKKYNYIDIALYSWNL